MQLFVMDNVKIQLTISRQFTSYQEMIYKLDHRNRFDAQITAMLTLALKTIRYPSWYDLSQGEYGKNEDEERYVELRNDLSIFIENLIKN